ncbi:MAG: hypothetical protein EZS28_034227 [Streblomastix strix]|uniref:AAA+ ATPase domain-containing protein n=1 Tax=Streblomastix strix TaxID=222440 RepID=A0A5J4UIG0_9EUKA|nr:MAG: hypothetical protein EZS28_034227 [Streblomastix strix]
MQIHWNDIIGQNDLKDILKDNLNHKKYRKIHFTGPPGNGKKMMARALATEGNLRFLLLRPEMIEGYNPARNIRIAFEYAAEVASSVLVIDCIDDLIGDGTSDQAKTIMAEMETQMSKVDITVIVTSSLCDLLPEEFMINFNNLTVQESEIDQMAQRSKGFSYTDLDKITETFDEIGKNRITVENILKLIDIQHMTINPDTI